MIIYEVKPYDPGWRLIRDGRPAALFSSAHKAISMAMHLVRRERQAAHEVRLARSEPARGQHTADLQE